MPLPISRYWTLLVTYFAPQRLRVALLAALLLSTTGLQLAQPQILRLFLDNAFAGGATERLLPLAMLVLGGGLVTQATAVMMTYVSNDVGWQATNRLRADLVRHCLLLDLPFHHAHSPGTLIERIDGDVTALTAFFSQFLLRLAGSLLLLLGVLALLWHEDWRIGLALAAFTFIALAVLARIREAATPAWRVGRQASADLFAFIEDRLAGIPDIRTAGAGAYILARFEALLRTHLRATRRARLLSDTIFNVGQTLLTAGSIMGLALGAHLFSIGAITIGTVYLIVQYAAMLAEPVRDLTRQVDILQRAAASIGRIDELVQLQPAIQDGTGVAPEPVPPAVEIDEVSFGYESGEPVLRDISVHLPPGTILGLLGRTASGKTTLARLLCRFYDPDAGSIRLDGVDLRVFRLAELRRYVGLVTQEVQLVGASLRDNLTLFDPAIDDSRIEQALRDLGLGTWYDGLPAGLDTELAPGGEGLSSGEAQLLAVTRVFLRDPGLIILDEASSRLDPATERLLDRALDRLLIGRTAVIIAHRLATVRRADQILILDAGRVVEQGERVQLVAAPRSRFARLLQIGLAEALE